MLSKLVVLAVLFGVMQFSMEAVGILRAYPLEIPPKGFTEVEARELARAEAKINASSPVTQWVVATFVGIRVQAWAM